MRRLLSLLVLGLGLGLGVVVAWRLLSPGRAAPPDPPAVVEKVRQVARLEALEVRGREVALVLPPLLTRVELLPGETEVIGSNLDSAETARPLELAKVAFEREVQADRGLQGKARTGG